MSTLNSNQSPSSHPETRGNNNYKSTAKSANGENSKYDSDNNSQSRSNSGRRKPRTNNSNGNNGNNSNRSTNKPGQNNQLNRRPKNIANDSDDAYSKTTSAISETDSKANIDINCFICTEPIKIFAVGECEHRTCHVCSLRLRALYKNKHCAYCKTELTWVIFTEDPIREYSSFGDTEAACVDSSLGIRYQYQETFAESTRLLKFSCPKEGCTAVVSHWGKLKAHARDEHRLSFCDLCVKFKKAFPFEHRLFTRAQLRDHYRGVSRETSIGFRGHPECGFCHQDYYDDDQLYEHCRDRHEQCHLCVRSGTGRHQYYRNYKELEKHFHQDHFPCMYESCLESKFVVFSTDIDLKAHEVSSKIICSAISLISFLLYLMNSMKFTVLLLPDNDHYSVMHGGLTLTSFMLIVLHNDNEEGNNNNNEEEEIIHEQIVPYVYYYRDEYIHHC
ncbi:hypothetical protein BDF22DRAFT_618912 [Syncephalis plumigaleata]|nr:hypothetical protein BDF22DRAFT_618912 [Syncephalis plumigaleata]